MVNRDDDWLHEWNEPNQGTRAPRTVSGVIMTKDPAMGMLVFDEHTQVDPRGLDLDAYKSTSRPEPTDESRDTRAHHETKERGDDSDLPTSPLTDTEATDSTS